jgi:hypothetical protein
MIIALVAASRTRWFRENLDRLGAKIARVEGEPERA